MSSSTSRPAPRINARSNLLSISTTCTLPDPTYRKFGPGSTRIPGMERPAAIMSATARPTPRPSSKRDAEFTRQAFELAAQFRDVAGELHLVRPDRGQLG